MPIYSKLPDQDLFSLVKSEDPAAFKEIYERYFSVLFIHAYKRLQDKEEAQDVVQEIFAILWNMREDISLKGSLPAYLYAAVRNKTLNIISRKQIESTYIESIQEFINQGVCQTDHLARENHLKTLIESEIASLPPKMQKIFLLSREEYLSHQEIALELNISKQTVKKQVNYALRILRTRLGLFLALLTLLQK